MVRKQELYERARALRKSGESIRRIARTLGVSTGSASLWCRDIVLSPSQREALDLSASLPRLAALRSAVLKNRKFVEERRSAARDKGAARIRDFDDYGLLLLGLGLYLGDGTKVGRTCRFASANVAILRFMLDWFERCFDVSRDRFVFRVTIHEMYRDDVPAIEQEWRDELGVEPDAFRSRVLITSKRPPPYSERGTYKGTVALSVRKSSGLLHEILGMAELLVYKGSTHRPG